MNISRFKQKRITVMFSAFFFLANLLFTQCKKDKSGLGVDPQEDQVGLKIDTISLFTHTILGDSIPTDELSTSALLGTYSDPYFGKVSAGIYTQIRLSGAVDFTPTGGTLNDLVVDSAILYIAMTSGYGNFQAQDFEIYQLSENLYKDSTYYSNRALSIAATNLVAAGEASIIPNLSSAGYVGAQLVAEPILRIPLSVADFAQPIINQSGSGVLGGNNGAGKFVEWFKGLYITTKNTSQIANEGAILYTDLLSSNSKITIYYRDNSGIPSEYDTIQYDLNINSDCARYSNLNQDYTNTPIASQLSNPSEGQEVFFLQTMGGVKSEISFPSFTALADSGNIIINKAELVLPVQYFQGDAYPPPNELFLVRKDSNGIGRFIADYNDNRGGNFESGSKKYTFALTRHLNDILNGSIENTPLSLLANGNGVSANRVVFNGAQSLLKEQPKLIITYSKYE